MSENTERDFFMTPEAAKEYGLIDDIIQAPAKAGVPADGEVARTKG